MKEILAFLFEALKIEASVVMSSTAQIHEAEMISCIKMWDKKEWQVNDYEPTP